VRHLSKYQFYVRQQYTTFLSFFIRPSFCSPTFRPLTFHPQTLPTHLSPKSSRHQLLWQHLPRHEFYTCQLSTCQISACQFHPPTCLSSFVLPSFWQGFSPPNLHLPAFRPQTFSLANFLPVYLPSTHCFKK
jgi:hypothetical protein